MEFKHESVLLNECIDGLNICPDGIYVDATLGGAGHSEQIAKRLTTGLLIGIDQDDKALSAASKRLEPYKENVKLVKDNFRNIKDILKTLNIEGVNGVLADLGVSSPQLDEKTRGFSYMNDSPLDMRMDNSSPFSAYDLVNNYDEEQIKRILYEYGEEKFAPRIAGAIVKKRSVKPIETTFELVDIIKGAMPGAALNEKQHPAKRSFQAIRIAVNDELAAERELVDDAIDMLVPGGRLAVISFHSLEDRIMKEAIQKRTKGCTCPPDFPVCVCGFRPSVKSITKKPIVASDEELKRNPRSRSAKLRIIEKI